MAKVTKKYAVYPGFVQSEHDGDRHYINFGELCKLYGVLFSECVNMSFGRSSRNLIELRPRQDGNYSKPEK